MNPTGKILAVGDPRVDTQLRNVLLHGIFLGSALPEAIFYHLGDGSPGDRRAGAEQR